MLFLHFDRCISLIVERHAHYSLSDADERRASVVDTCSDSSIFIRRASMSSEYCLTIETRIVRRVSELDLSISTVRDEDIGISVKRIY